MSEPMSDQPEKALRERAEQLLQDIEDDARADVEDFARIYGVVTTLLAALTAAERERDALRPYVQHTRGCKALNDGLRWEPQYTRGRWTPTEWYGAWVLDPSAKHDCTCGLASLLSGAVREREQP